MPDKELPGSGSTLLEKDADAVVPRLQLAEQGSTGLTVRNGRIISEAQAAFRYPAFINTVNEMRNNPTVGAAINVYRMMMSRVEWVVQPSATADAKDKARAAVLQTMLHDMEHSWHEFIESVLPYLEYGFGINEIVLRRRLKRNGSKYNDGLIGIKKLPVRNQDTICSWNFSDDGSKLVSVEQNTKHVDAFSKVKDKTNAEGNLEIAREKFLLFSASSDKGNPEGNSVYKNIYLAFKQLTLLQEQELIGIAKDVQGILKIGIPPQYLDPNASLEHKLVIAAFQKIIDNYNAGTQRGLLVPHLIDPDAKLPLFTYDLMESKGSAKYDTENVIKRLQSDILSALSVDILKLGAEGAGSFSLAESKASVLAMAVDYRLKEIREVLNFHLVRLIYEHNGWGCENLPTFEYKDIEEISLEEFSKALQRIFSVGAIEIDREVLNRVRKLIGVSAKAEDAEVEEDKLSTNMTGKSSRSGDGMEVGRTGNGTSTDPNSVPSESAGKDDNND